MKLWIFGGSGTLGRHVITAAKERGHSVFDPIHEACFIERRSDVDSLFASAQAMRENGPRVPDAIINCAGVDSEADFHNQIMINGLGPHNLAHLGIRLVHMSTDAVFSGEEYRDNTWQSQLDKEDRADPVTLYGRAKLLGEPMLGHVLVVRGSFIDPSAGFLHWLLNARGRVDAWAGVHWNGTSAERMAQHLVELAEGETVGICHVAAIEDVTKAWMVEYFADVLDLRLTINIVREPILWHALLPDIETIPVKEMCDELIAEINGVRS